MKKENLNSINRVALITLLSACCFIANAQKLPNVQKGEMPAPTSVKIDGDAKEWGDKFQAYNKAMHISYTIANDNDNLYLVVQATDGHEIQKILGGGLTFTVTSQNKKAVTMPVAITYPRLYPKDRMAIVSKIKNPDFNPDTDVPAINKLTSDNSKLIEVTGIKEIPDSLISVYNEEQIKSASLFDRKKALTFELSIPLKYLKTAIGEQQSFNYNIALKGLLNSLKPPKTDATKVVAGVMSIRISEPDPAAVAAQQDLMAATDFSGTYTLAKI